MNNLSLKGIGVALVVPFNNDLSIDWIGYEKLINHVIDGGVNYVVVNGTTGRVCYYFF
jgi:4-hydroxy-tetrahydrodipicolinate synthase